MVVAAMFERLDVRPTMGRPRKITAGDIEILEFVVDFIGRHGYSPSYREIQTGCSGNPSTSVIRYSLDKWETAGMITRLPDAPRSIVVTGSVMFVPELTGIKSGQSIKQVKRYSRRLKDNLDNLLETIKELSDGQI